MPGVAVAPTRHSPTDALPHHLLPKTCRRGGGPLMVRSHLLAARPLGGSRSGLERFALGPSAPLGIGGGGGTLAAPRPPPSRSPGGVLTGQTQKGRQHYNAPLAPLHP